MLRLSKHCHRDPCTRVSHAGQCDVANYLGVSRIGNWTTPNMSVEGPTGNVNHFGNVKPWCSDCSSCVARYCATSEYIPVEFARDVEIQAQGLPTTQHVVGDYLSKSPQRLCIVNAGLHDMEIEQGKIPSSVYVQNVHTYMKLLRPGCKNILWVHTSTVKDEKRYIHLQNNTFAIHNWVFCEYTGFIY